MKLNHFLPQNFTFKIASCFLILFAIPSILLLNRLYYISKEISFNETGDYLTSTLKSTADNFDELLRNVDFLHTQVLSDSDFIKINADLTPHSETYSYKEFQLQNNIMNKLTKYYISNTYIYSLTLYNKKADTLYLYSMDYQRNSVINHPSEKLLEDLKMISSEDEKKYWNIQKEYNGENYVFNSTSVPNIFQKSESPLYFMISVNSELLKNRADFSPNNNIGLCIIDSQNTLLPIKSSKENLSSETLLDTFMNYSGFAPGSSYSSITINDIPYIASTYKAPYTNFTYIAYTPTLSINKTPLLIKKYQTIFLMILSILFIAVLFITFKYVLKPIKNLHKSFSRVGDGDLTVRLNARSKDEIGQIYNHFNQMMDKLNLLITENYETRLVKKETELKYIHSQINEHFLYNTLDSIHWIAKQKHVPEISRIIFSLSKFFRMVLSEGDDTITVAQVIHIFTHYIELLNIRTDPGIEFTYTIEEGLEDIQVLKYVFHPLLENALLHGVDQNEFEKKVTVLFQKISSDQIRFTIKDNGVGISPERLESILAHLHEDSNLTEDKYFALSNINKQLNLFYGYECNLFIESTQNLGTTVYFDIPFTSQED